MLCSAASLIFLKQSLLELPAPLWRMDSLLPGILGPPFCLIPDIPFVSPMLDPTPLSNIPLILAERIHRQLPENDLQGGKTSEALYIWQSYYFTFSLD